MTGQELTRPVSVVSPITGEQLELDRPSTDLAQFLADVREAESLLREAKSLVGGELLRRLDQGACWTLHLDGGLTIKAPSPAPAEEFDELALRDDLAQLVEDGTITEAAAAAAVETVVTYKVRKAGITALRKLGGTIAATIDRHARPVEKPRYVSVSRT